MGLLEKWWPSINFGVLTILHLGPLHLLSAKLTSKQVSVDFCGNHTFSQRKDEGVLRLDRHFKIIQEETFVTIWAFFSILMWVYLRGLDVNSDILEFRKSFLIYLMIFINFALYLSVRFLYITWKALLDKCWPFFIFPNCLWRN